MQVIRNNGFVRKKKRRGRIVIGLGLVMLLGSAAPLFFSGSSLIIPAYIMLGIGFMFFIFGSQQTAKWSRNPPVYEVIDNALGRLNDRFAIIHYAELGSHSPEHILVTPGGVAVVTAKDVGGKVTLTGSKWGRRGSPMSRMFNLGAPQLGNPSVENEMELDALERIYDEEGLPGDIEGVIVFLQDDVEIVMKDPEIDVVHVSELQDYARELGSDVTLTGDDRNRIIEALSRGDDIEQISARPRRARKKIRAT